MYDDAPRPRRSPLLEDAVSVYAARDTGHETSPCILSIPRQQEGEQVKTPDTTCQQLAKHLNRCIATLPDRVAEDEGFVIYLNNYNPSSLPL